MFTKQTNDAAICTLLLNLIYWSKNFSQRNWSCNGCLKVVPKVLSSMSPVNKCGSENNSSGWNSAAIECIFHYIFNLCIWYDSESKVLFFTNQEGIISRMKLCKHSSFQIKRAGNEDFISHKKDSNVLYVEAFIATLPCYLIDFKMVRNRP